MSSVEEVANEPRALEAANNFVAEGLENGVKTEISDVSPASLSQLAPRGVGRNAPSIGGLAV